MRRAVVVPVVLLLLAGAALVSQPGAAATAHGRAPASGWSVLPSPNPRAATGLLNAVSCSTAAGCVAVGLHVRESGLGVTLAERRTGGVWRVQPTPVPHGASASAFNGVSCASRSTCTAVGQFFGRSGAQRPLAEHWNGSRWRLQSVPHPVGASATRLSAVDCPTVDRCTAVGTSDSTLLIEAWRGSGWRMEKAPLPAGAQSSELNAVSCTRSSCTAVGDFVDSDGVDVSLAERRTDGRWRVVRTADPAGASFSVLTGVSCASRQVCQAVGGSDSGALAERWDGARWVLQDVPSRAGAQFDFLFNVSCAGASCEAVGISQDGSGAWGILADQWDGGRWRAQSTPAAASTTSYLGGVSCPTSSACTAVGQGNGDGTPVAIAERWRAPHWSAEHPMSPAGAAENQLDGIVCPATDRCVAVGFSGPTRGAVSPEAQLWDGTSWRLQRVPTVPGAELYAVSCSSGNRCTAVGQSDAGTLAERWDGRRWAIQHTPDPTHGQRSELNAVSCSTRSDCVAVGSYYDRAGEQLVLAEHWDGRAWKIAATPRPTAQPANAFNGVACPKSSACIAVGASFDQDSNPAGTFAERWDGGSWKLQPTPTARTAGGYLASVWCASATACMATGSTSSGTLAERLSGKRWRVLSTPDLPDTQGDYLGSLSCTSLSACTGAGAAKDSSNRPVLVVERWNGVRWRVQSTPLLPGIHDGDFSQAVACPALDACMLVGGFEDDGPGSKTLAERWRPGAPVVTGGASSVGPRSDGRSWVRLLPMS